MAERKTSNKLPQDSSKGDLSVSDIATAREFEEKNEVKQHPTLDTSVGDAIERAREEKANEVQSDLDGSRQRATSQPDFRRDGNVEAILVDHARKEIDTERTDVARDAGILGDGQYRVPATLLERVPVQHDANEGVDGKGRNRRFDVGGQPVEADPETVAKSRANFEAEMAKERKKNA